MHSNQTLLNCQPNWHPKALLYFMIIYNIDKIFKIKINLLLLSYMVNVVVLLSIFCHFWDHLGPFIMSKTRPSFPRESRTDLQYKKGSPRKSLPHQSVPSNQYKGPVTWNWKKNGEYDCLSPALARPAYYRQMIWDGAYITQDRRQEGIGLYHSRGWLPQQDNQNFPQLSRAPPIPQIPARTTRRGLIGGGDS